MFSGAYSEYKAARLAESGRKPPAVPAGTSRPLPGAVEAAPAPRPSKMEQRRRQQRVMALEAEITRLEKELLEITRQLESPSSNLGRIQRLGQEYTRIHALLEDRMEEWGRSSEE
jgi:hypothetical protein